MTDKDILELQNMFTIAAQIAKSKDRLNYVLNLDESTFIEYLKQAFPYIKEEKKLIKLAKTILSAN